MPKGMLGKVCVSCGRLTTDYTDFVCPVCGKTEIIRCKHCRKIANTYMCNSCGFEGP
ncbi:MAG: RNA-binding protein [Candidatus Micrarchaeota archaeon]|nr:MAG: RNA-binding protein [Candidatus Micrarchaeota archaeon]